MTLFEFISVLLLLVAVLGIVNHRYLRLPRTIGLMATALVFSILIVIADHEIEAVELRQWWGDLVEEIHLPDLFLNGVLAFMLFAGSLHTDVENLRKQRWPVGALATLGVVLATVLYAFGIYYVVDQSVPLPWCFALGALLAPTDPIAVGGLLKKSGLPAPVLAVVNGESLFNDGVAVVVFAVALEWADGNATTPAQIGLELLTEAGGGIVLGLAGGWLAERALRLIDEPALELTVTLALVAITYAVAARLHVSGPLAVVIAGLLTGHRSARTAMSERSREQVIQFWDMLDELLNAGLFVLMGLTLLSVEISPRLLLIAAAGVGLALVTRLLSVAIPAVLTHLPRLPPARAIAVLTWGGLRGGISIALALTLGPSPYRGVLLAVCYGVVVFTILVQGLTMPAVVRRLYPRR